MGRRISLRFQSHPVVIGFRSFRFLKRTIVVTVGTVITLVTVVTVVVVVTLMTVVTVITLLTVLKVVTVVTLVTLVAVITMVTAVILVKLVTETKFPDKERRYMQSGRQKHIGDHMNIGCLSQSL